MSSMALTTSATVSSLDLPKSLFDYDVVDFVGTGAGSRIYAVSHPETRQIFALKHVVRKTDRDARFIAQLENEHEVGRQVNHPVLRRVFDIKLERTILRKVVAAALIMELFDGTPLDMELPNSLTDLVECFVQTAQALESMHTMGYVHCDLKPNNILRGPRGQVKVIDFGQACPNGTAKERIQGTPDYIAPEQVRLLPVTPRTDVYNLGATMYWCLTGQKVPTLFTLKRGENSFLVDGQIPAPHALNPNVPENLSNLVMECVRTNPAKRPENAAELVHRLELVQHTLSRDSVKAAG